MKPFPRRGWKTVRLEWLLGQKVGDAGFAQRVRQSTRCVLINTVASARWERGSPDSLDRGSEFIVRCTPRRRRVTQRAAAPQLRRRLLVERVPDGRTVLSYPQGVLRTVREDPGAAGAAP